MDNKFVNGTMLSDFAKKIKNNIKTDLLDGKKLKYVTQAEYDALTDDKKNDENIIYNITDADIQEGFSGDYNDLENRPCYQDKGDIPEYLNIEIYPDTDFSDKEYVEVINGTADNGNCIIYRKYVKLFSDITIDMINTMKEYGVFISKYEGQLIENPLIDLLDESQADQGMYSIGREFEFILQAPEGYYLPENGLWYEESYIDRDLNGNLIAEYKTVDDFEGILLIKDNGKLNTVTIKQLDEKFIPDTIATKKYVDDAISENGFSGDYNDLENRPCYDEIKSIECTYDGNATGRVVATDPFESMVKVSDEVIDYETYLKSVVGIHYPDGIQYHNISDKIEGEDYFLTKSKDMIWGGDVTVVYEDNVELFGAVFPEKGIYFCDSSLLIGYDDPSYTCSFIAEVGGELKQLDEKFIPDTIATKQYVDDAISENGFSGDYNDLTNKPNIPSVEGLASESYVDSHLDNKSFVFLTQAEYDALSDVEKNDENIVYQIIDGQISYNDLIDTPSLVNFATKDYVTDAINRASLEGGSGGSINLDIYALKTDLHSHNNKSVLDSITQDNITNWNSKTSFSGNYNDLTNKPTIPTKTSQLTNDSGFLKSIPSEYITETDLNGKGYATTNQIPTKVSQLTNDNKYLSVIPSEYITETDLNAKGYATANQIPTKTSQLTNDSGYLTYIPSEYVTETELSDKGYLTQHQSLTDYAKKSDIPTKTSNLTNDSQYITRDQLNTALDNLQIVKITKAEYNQLSTKDPNTLYLIVE